MRTAGMPIADDKICKSGALDKQFCDTCAKLGRPAFLFCQKSCCTARVAKHMAGHSSVRKATGLFEPSEGENKVRIPATPTSGVQMNNRRIDSSAYTAELLATIERLEAQIVSDSAKIKAFENEQRRKDSYMTNLQSAMRGIGLELEDLIDENGQKKKKGRFLQGSGGGEFGDEGGSVEQLRESLSTLQERASEQQERVEVLNQDNSSLLEELERTRNERMELSGKNMALQLALDATSVKTSSLTFKVKELESSLAAYKIERNELETKNRELMLKFLGANQKTSELDVDMSSAGSVIKSLQMNASELQETILSLQNIHRNDNVRYESLDREHKTQMVAYAAKEQTAAMNMAELLRELEELRSTLESVKCERDEVISAYKLAQEESRKVNEKAMSMNTANGRLTKELSSIKLELKAHEDRVKDRDAELSRQESAIKRESTEQNTARRQAEGANLKMLGQLDAAYKQCSVLQREVTSAREEVQVMSTAQRDLKALNEALKLRVSQLEDTPRNTEWKEESGEPVLTTIVVPDESSEVYSSIDYEELKRMMRNLALVEHTQQYTTLPSTSIIRQNYDYDFTNMTRIKNELNESRDTLRMYRSLNDDLRTMQNEFRSKLIEMENRYSIAMTANASLTSDLNNSKININEKYIENNAILGRMEGLYAEIALLKQDVGKADLAKEHVMTDLRTVEYDRASLRQTLEERESMLEMLGQKCSTISELGESYRLSNLALSRDLAEAHSSLQLRSEELNMSNARVMGLESALRATEEHMGLRQNELKDTSTELSLVLTAAEELERQLGSLRKNYDALSAAAADNLKEIAMLRSQQNNATHSAIELSEYKETCAALAAARSEVDRVREEYALSMEKSKTSSEESEKLETDLVISLLMIMEDFAQTSANYYDLNTQSKMLVDCIESLETELEKKAASLLQHEMELARLRSNFAELQTTMAELNGLVNMR